MRVLRAAILAALIVGIISPQLLVAQSDSDASTESTDLRLRIAERLVELSDAELDELLEAGELSFRYGLDDTPQVSTRFAPAFTDEIRDDLLALDPKIGVEVVFLVEAPASIHSVDADLLTTLRAFSTMEGIEYYSASRDRMRTLFYDSYVIAGPDDTRPLPDPVVREISEREVLHVYQRDSSFGRNVYEITYVTHGEAVRLRMQNLSRMYYQGIIPAVGPDQLGLNLVVYPLGDHLLFYGNSAARPATLLGMEERVQRSFYNRLVALYRWFMSRSE